MRHVTSSIVWMPMGYVVVSVDTTSAGSEGRQS